VYKDVEGNKTCKLRLRKTRIPELGDKMAAVHGQKGVIGLILPAVDMPSTVEGITPDIIINPHAFPSRMTIGQLLECVLAKTAVHEGMMVDATPFNNTNYESVYELLETKYGLHKHGNEIMYNGRTGTQIHTDIFIGPTYYQRLKHMVGDKMNYRLNGPRTLTTRQPTQGRGNNGGLRIGEMERDSVLSHGMMAFLKESLMERSDKYVFDIENATGTIAITNKKERLFTPQADHQGTFYSSICTPYAFKLFLQEVMSMGVKPILMTDVKDVADDAYSEDDEECYDDNELLGVIDEDEDAVVGVAGVAGVAGVRDPIDS
jgi:DNA-directed RNA polymerase II subunit RPB2